MSTTNLGIIGLGYIGHVHLLNCLKLENAQLTAVADLSKKALNTAKRLGVPNTYNDYRDLLKDKNIDAVVIALPTHLHSDAAKAAAENDKHILLEKPLARNTSEGREILSAVNKHNTKLMIGHSARFSEIYQELKTKIESGELGEIQIAYATNISSGPFMHRADADAPKPVPDWWWSKELTGGGVLIDLGSHMINLTRWYFGEVIDAKSYLGYRFNLDQEDHAVCILKFKKGEIGIINVGWFSQKSQFTMDVYGTAGHATATRASPSKVKTAIHLMFRKTSPFYLSNLRQLQHFVDCIQKDKQPQPSGEEALKDLEVIERAYANQIKLD